MPALAINTSSQPPPSSSSPPTATTATTATTTTTNPTNPPSPTAPPYSPITPILSTTIPSAPLNTYSSTPSFIPPQPPKPKPPSPLPISSTDNPDALALRSALSILQIQRQQTLRDLQKLEALKKDAVADPPAFLQAVKDGRVRTALSGGLVIGGREDMATQMVEEEEGEGESGGMEKVISDKKFEDIPGPQNIVRCPPIEWGKYRVVGEALDKLHEEERRRPGGERAVEDVAGARVRVPEAVIAAPYDAFLDRLGEEGMRTRRRTREGSGA